MKEMVTRSSRKVCSLHCTHRLLTASLFFHARENFSTHLKETARHAGVEVGKRARRSVPTLPSQVSRFVPASNSLAILFGASSRLLQQSNKTLDEKMESCEQSILRLVFSL